MRGSPEAEIPVRMRIGGLALSTSPDDGMRAGLSTGDRCALPLPCLLLLALAFARGVTRVALGLLLGLQRGQPGGFFFLFARDPGGFRRGGLGLETLLLGLGGFLASLALARAAAWASRSA